MPEGPEVKLQAFALNALLADNKLIKVKVRKNQHKNFARQTTKLNKESKDNIVNFILVESKGKCIYFKLALLETSDKSKETLKGYKYIYNHLMLSGNWRFGKTKHTTLKIKYYDYKEEKEKTLYFDDYMRFGIFELLTNKTMKEKLESIGPDVITMDKSQFDEAMEPYKNSKKIIAEFLIDQHILSGIGNYLRADIMYVSKVNPKTQVKNVNMDKLFKSIKKTIQKSYNAGGTTIKTYKNVSSDSKSITEKGRYDPIIYNKKFDLNNNQVEKIKSQGRTIYWVPNIQCL